MTPHDASALRAPQGAPQAAPAAHPRHHHAPDLAAPRKWQRGVPLDTVPLWTPAARALASVALVGILVAIARLASPLGPFSGMNDAYPWGVWKTFNVMTLTALGSGALALGLIVWVFDRRNLHVVMRPALVTSFLLYLTGLVALVSDVGRPWNFWNVLVPSHWNTHSALFEVSVAMPIYCMLFLAFENVPLVAERFSYVGPDRVRGWLRRWKPRIEKAYPWAIAGAYLLPLGHQSSLGALLLLAGPKLDPLWQTQWLPALYVGQALVSGTAFVLVLMLVSCLAWRRPLDRVVLDELATWLSRLSLGWLALRGFDLAWRGQLDDAARRLAAGDGHAIVFWLETLCVLVPALAFRAARWRRTPRRLFAGALVALAGGLLYRFVPTTIAFDPGHGRLYFPTLPELLVTVGLMALACLGYTVAVKLFAVLPAPLTAWYEMLERDRVKYPTIRRDAHGNPTDD